MKKAFVILFYIMIASLIVFAVFIFFIAPSWLVQEIDGESNKVKTHTDYVHLNDHFYLDSKDNTIIKKIAPDLIELIIQDKVDSLCWNDTLIMGFSNKKYFQIKHSEKLTGSTYLKLEESIGKFHQFYKIPAFHGMIVKDTIYY